MHARDRVEEGAERVIHVPVDVARAGDLVGEARDVFKNQQSGFLGEQLKAQREN